MTNILSSLANFAIKPEEFITENKDKNFTKMPFYYSVIGLYTIGVIIKKLDSLLFINIAWPYIIIAIIIGIILSTVFQFFIEFMFYNFRIFLSGGTINDDLTKKIISYTKIYKNLFLIIFLIIIGIYSFSRMTDFFSNLGNIVFPYGIGLLLILSYHSIYLSYRIVSKTTDIKKIRGIIFFIILPLIFTTIFSFVFFI